MILLGPLETSLESRNTIAASTAKRSLSAKSVLRNMLFNLIGRRTRKLVALVSISATVARCSPGTTTFDHLFGIGFWLVDVEVN